jgi:hypothetical protein
VAAVVEQALLVAREQMVKVLLEAHRILVGHNIQAAAVVVQAKSAATEVQPLAVTAAMACNTALAALLHITVVVVAATCKKVLHKALAVLVVVAQELIAALEHQVQQTLAVAAVAVDTMALAAVAVALVLLLFAMQDHKKVLAA